MELILMLLGASAVVELLVVRPLWRVRKWGAIVVVGMISGASGALLALKPGVATGLIFILSAYRIFNMLRMVEGRMNEGYLRHTVGRSSVTLLLLQAICFSVWWAAESFVLPNNFWLGLLVIVQLAGGFILVVTINRRLQRSKLEGTESDMSDKELPSVSVLIPARNEDELLEDCLHSVLASDYPKLEVIVADDCSHDATPEIIRKFAQDGVRFVACRPPEENWLAKNQTYEQLAQEASGSVLLFCGVDARFEPQSIRRLVSSMIHKKKSMLSIMPINQQLHPSPVQAMRYFWELAPPRRLFNRPPVLSTCWLIAKDTLKDLGMFTGVQRTVVPEARFARELIKTDAYAFAHSSLHVGVASVKNFADQRRTVVRMRYPQLHRRPEMVAFIALAELSSLLGPFLVVLIGAFAGVPLWIFGVAGCTVLLLVGAYRAVEYVAFPHERWRIVPLLPVAVLLDVYFMHYSMWKYEFSEVIWKERNVCIPVMRVIPHLPKID